MPSIPLAFHSFHLATAWAATTLLLHYKVHQLLGGQCRDRIRVYSWIGGDRPSGVAANAIAPGYVETQKAVDFWNSFPAPVAAQAETMRLHPGGQIASTQEIAMAAVFMITAECPFMNATCLSIEAA